MTPSQLTPRPKFTRITDHHDYSINTLGELERACGKMERGVQKKLDNCRTKRVGGEKKKEVFKKRWCLKEMWGGEGWEMEAGTCGEWEGDTEEPTGARGRRERR